MEFKNILAVSGKPGLFQLVGQMKNGVVVESLVDKKREPAYASQNISSLEDISIYTNDEDIPLIDVFKKIYEDTKGKRAEVSLSDSKALKAYFKKVVADYDEDRVYVSDIKKTIKWFNILVDAKFFKEEKKEKAPAKKATKPAAKKTTSKSEKTTEKAPAKKKTKAKATKA